MAGQLRRALRRGLPALVILVAAVPTLTVSAIPLEDQARPDAQEYADAARHVVDGEGYVTDVEGGENAPPVYPPGFSLALVPFVELGGDFPDSAQSGAKLFAVLLFASVVGTAWLLGGAGAAAAAAVIVAISPFARDLARTVMSDAFSALFTVLAVALLTRPNRITTASAGLLAGASTVVRLSNVAIVASLAASLRRPRLVAIAVAASLPFLVGLAIYHWDTFGSPLKTGYGYHQPGLETFSASYIFEKDLAGDGSFIVHDRARNALTRWSCPCRNDDPMNGLANIFFYPAVLLGGYWIFAPPFLSVVGLWELVRRRRSVVGRFALLVVATNLLLYIPYFHRGARFMAPAGMILVVFTAVGLRRLAGEVMEWYRARGSRAPVPAAGVRDSGKGIRRYWQEGDRFGR